MKRVRWLSVVTLILAVAVLVVLVLALLGPSALPLSLFDSQRMARSLKSCGPPTAGLGIDVAQARTAREMSPDVNPATLDELVAGNNAFAFDLYRQVAAEADGNLIFSPYSISQALTMTYAGARGDTAQQMQDGLHLTLPPEDLHPAANALDIDLTSREYQDWAGEPVEGFELNIANAIWGQDGYAYLAEFLEVMALNYGAGLRQVDFENAPEAAREAINRWTCQETEKRITELVPPGVITSDTRLVLTNAIYFNAQWDEKFERQATHPDTFFLLDGGRVTVPMMAGAKASGYWAGENYRAVELAYVGGDLAMLVIVPDEGAFGDVESSLDADTFATMRDLLGGSCAPVTMPRFDDNYALSLTDTLQAMGIKDAFSPLAADLSGMTGERELFISDVLHNADIRVDEEGTEAAAATGVFAELISACIADEVRIDRPFIYAIYDRETGSTLFLGRVLNPAA